MIGVCFKKGEQDGQRQRIFLAASASPLAAFTPIGTVMDPECGENRHPDALILKDKFEMVYQEREGNEAHQHWHLRRASFDLEAVKRLVEEKLRQPKRNR